MRDALNRTGVPITFSFEPHLQVPIAWPPLIGNSWRAAFDIRAKYSSILGEIRVTNAWASVSQPGAWSDADILEVGNSGLSLPEARTHFAMWCMVKSPLLIGCDLTDQPSSILDLLKNKHLIGISQDPLGEQAVLVASYPGPQGTVHPPVDPARLPSSPVDPAAA